MSGEVRVIHGPNLNLLGRREPEVYGRTTLAELDAAVAEEAAKLGLDVRCTQSNHEGEIVSLIHAAAEAGAAGVVLNPGGYAHTSVAIRDAIAAVALPVVEVHLSNVFEREGFRHTLLTAAACRGVIAGFGTESYLLAMRVLAANG